MASKIAPLIHTQVHRIQKVEWLQAFVQAHDNVFNLTNIQNAFDGAGLVPYWPYKVIRRVNPEYTSSLPRTPSPPPSPTSTPFNSAVLTSSPMDMDAVQVANQALNVEAIEKQHISTPARNYLPYLVRTNDRLQAKNAILTRERDELSAVVKARKERATGRRKTLKGKHIITVDDLRAVRDAEKSTSEKKQKRGGNQPNNTGEVGVALRNDIETTLDPALEDMTMVDGAVDAES